MVNKEQLDLIKKGVPTWNEWIRKNANTDIMPEIDLSKADLSMANLSWANLIGADLRKADLRNADLRNADLIGADFRNADLSNADLSNADFNGANFCGANLIGADIRNADFIGANLNGANIKGVDLRKASLPLVDLSYANFNRVNLSNADLRNAILHNADLRNADLRNADLSEAIIVETNFEKANLTGCRIYGISARDVNLQEAIQSDLIITSKRDPTITVDNLEVAQSIYLLLNNEKICNVVNTATSKFVLILGRFGKHKAILDMVRNELRKNNYLPIMLDFKTPANRDMTKTVLILAHLAGFVIADIIEPTSIPQELQAIIPGLAVPVQLLLLECSTGEYAIFQDLRKKYHWVLETYQYQNITTLLDYLIEKVIAPAEAKEPDLEKR